VHEAVHFVKDGDVIDRLVRNRFEVHWFGESVGFVVWDLQEAAAAFLRVSHKG
jgi:hypothetical protein